MSHYQATVKINNFHSTSSTCFKWVGVHEMSLLKSFFQWISNSISLSLSHSPLKDDSFFRVGTQLHLWWCSFNTISIFGQLAFKKPHCDKKQTRLDRTNKVGNHYILLLCLFSCPFDTHLQWIYIICLAKTHSKILKASRHWEWDWNSCSNKSTRSYYTSMKTCLFFLLPYFSSLVCTASTTSLFFPHMQ